LEYEQAVELLAKALEATDLPSSARTEGYKYLALTQVATGKENDARDSFRKLLEIDRKFQLSRTENPKARELLEEVRLSMPNEIAITQQLSPSSPKAQSPITIDISVTDEDRLHRGVVVFHRTKGQKKYSTTQAVAIGGGQYAATIAGAFVATPQLEYYVRATASDGRALAEVGSADTPLAIVVAEATKSAATTSDGGSIFGKWWFWTGAAAVVGGSVAAFVILSDDSSGPAPVQVNITFDIQN
jgi:tetratricopeptide (TPR) repeat protein